MVLITSDRPDESRTYQSAQLRPVLAAYKASINALSEQQIQIMDATAKDAVSPSNQARLLLIALGAMASLVAAGIGWVITRSLLKQLGGEPGEAAEIAQAVSQGDFTRSVPLGAGDTTSLMASLSAMQGNLAQVVTTVRQGSEGVATASA